MYNYVDKGDFTCECLDDIVRSSNFPQHCNEHIVRVWIEFDSLQNLIDQRVFTWIDMRREPALGLVLQS